jgi:disulfide bond formation protein DsbB
MCQLQRCVASFPLRGAGLVALKRERQPGLRLVSVVALSAAAGLSVAIAIAKTKLMPTVRLSSVQNHVAENQM